MNKYKLKDLVIKIGSGATPSGGKSSYSRSGVSLIRSQNVLDFTFSFNGLARINDDQANKLSNVIVEPEDVLLNITGDSVARVCQVPNSILPARVNQHVAIIRTQKTKLNPGFLKYYLLNPIFKLNLLSLSSAGATRQALTKRMIEELELTLPSIEFQLVIVKILSSLDDKIELNLQMNKTLESIAQAIFKEWFVDYRFPGFNGEMVDGLPKGWRNDEFINHITAERGLSYKGIGLSDEGNGIPMNNLNSIYEGGGYKYEGIKYYNGEYKKRHIARPGDIIVANTEQGHKYLLIGYPAVVPGSYGETTIFSHHIYRVRPKSESRLTSQYIYYLLLQPNIRDQVVGCCNGTTVNMLKVDGLERPEFILPPVELIKKFSELVQGIWQRKETNFIANQTLIQIRDTLLPKLMNGKIKVT